MSLSEPNIIDMRLAWNNFCSEDMSTEESNEKFNSWVQEFKSIVVDKLIDYLYDEKSRIYREEDFTKSKRDGFDSCIEFISAYGYNL